MKRMADALGADAIESHNKRLRSNDDESSHAQQPEDVENQVRAQDALAGNPEQDIDSGSDVDLEDQAFEHERLNCLHLCSKIERHFPREIRDMIYDAMDGEYLNSEIPVQEYFEGKPWSQWKEFHASHPTYFSCPLLSDTGSVFKSRAAHWWYSEFVGNSMALELTERFYHSNRFTFPYGIDCIQKFLRTDIWGRDLLPGNLVRHINFDIRVQDIAKQRNQENLKQSLEDLFQLVNKNAEIRIHIFSAHLGLVGLLNLIGPKIFDARNMPLPRLQVYWMGRNERHGITDLFEGPWEGLQNWRNRMHQKVKAIKVLEQAG